MKRFTRNTLLSVAAAATLATSVQVVAHLDDKEPMQSYRQSYFTLVAMNFGPIGSMVASGSRPRTASPAGTRNPRTGCL